MAESLFSVITTKHGSDEGFTKPPGKALSWTRLPVAR